MSDPGFTDTRVPFTPPAQPVQSHQPGGWWDAPAIAVAMGGSEAGSGDGWSRCPCPAHGGTAPSLAIRLAHGDRLIVKCFSAGCDPDTIRSAIDRVLGTRFADPTMDIGALGPKPAHLTSMTETIVGNGTHAASNAAGSHASARKDEDGENSANADRGRPKAGVAWMFTQIEKIEKPDPANVRERLHRTVQATTPVVRGSLVYRYLTEIRGLTLPVIPKTLRQHPRLYHGPTMMAAPAMVAVVMDHKGRPIAIQRMWLSAATGGKAFGNNSRMMLGPCHGGSVHLAGNQDSEKLLVAEGIETALAAAQLAGVSPGVSVWACLSTSGMKALTVPLLLRRVVIAADHDANGAGAEAADDLARRLRRRGVHVDVRMPKDQGTDWNDVLLRRATANTTLISNQDNRGHTK